MAEAYDLDASPSSTAAPDRLPELDTHLYQPLFVEKNDYDLMTMMTTMMLPAGNTVNEAVQPAEPMGYVWGHEGLAGRQTWQQPSLPALEDPDVDLPWNGMGGGGMRYEIAQTMASDGTAYEPMVVEPSQYCQHPASLAAAQDTYPFEDASDNDVRGSRRKSTVKQEPSDLSPKLARSQKTRPAVKPNAKALPPAKEPRKSTVNKPRTAPERATRSRARRTSIKSEASSHGKSRKDDDSDRSAGGEDGGFGGGGGGGDDRQRSKREMNRVAAGKCRAKTRVATNKLQADERHLSEQGAYLLATADRLRNEVLFLKSELLRHSDCDCVLIRQYLAQMAKLVSEGSSRVPAPSINTASGRAGRRRGRSKADNKQAEQGHEED